MKILISRLLKVMKIFTLCHKKVIVLHIRAYDVVPRFCKSGSSPALKSGAWVCKRSPKERKKHVTGILLFGMIYALQDRACILGMVTSLGTNCMIWPRVGQHSQSWYISRSRKEPLNGRTLCARVKGSSDLGNAPLTREMSGSKRAPLVDHRSLMTTARGGSSATWCPWRRTIQGSP